MGECDTTTHPLSTACCPTQVPDTVRRFMNSRLNLECPGCKTRVPEEVQEVRCEECPGEASSSQGGSQSEGASQSWSQSSWSQSSSAHEDGAAGWGGKGWWGKGWEEQGEEGWGHEGWELVAGWDDGWSEEGWASSWWAAEGEGSSYTPWKGASATPTLSAAGNPRGFVLDHWTGDRGRGHPSQWRWICRDCHECKSQIENTWRAQTSGQMLPPTDAWLGWVVIDRLAGITTDWDAVMKQVNYWKEVGRDEVARRVLKALSGAEDVAMAVAGAEGGSSSQHEAEAWERRGAEAGEGRGSGWEAGREARREALYGVRAAFERADIDDSEEYAESQDY